MVQCVALLLSLLSGWQTGQTATTQFTAQSDAARAVEQMRGISMLRQAIAPSDGRIDPQERRRAEITGDLHNRGSRTLLA